MQDLHTLAIVLHAASATGAFLVGIVLLFQSQMPRQLRLARAVVMLLILMAVLLIIAILSHVTSLSTSKQINSKSLIMSALSSFPSLMGLPS